MNDKLGANEEICCTFAMMTIFVTLKRALESSLVIFSIIYKDSASESRTIREFSFALPCAAYLIKDTIDYDIGNQFVISLMTILR